MAVIVTDGNGHVLLCERTETPFEGKVQTVQGGIDRGETVREAGAREMYEEIGVEEGQFEILAESEKKYRYEWPEEYRKTLSLTNPYIGQEQQFLLVKVAPDTAFRFDRDAHQEFKSVRWGMPEELVRGAWESKQPGLLGALKEFGFLPQDFEVLRETLPGSQVSQELG